MQQLYAIYFYYFITIYYLMSSITVCVRMRPLLPPQQSQSHLKQRIFLQQKNSQVKVQLTEQRQKTFKFNNVFGANDSQQTVYDQVQINSLVSRVVDGYHSTVFAYGQTGSGKTYTIQGGDSPQTQGIIPKAIHDLFTTLQQRSANTERGYRVFISFIQIYNQAIFDLIDPNDGKPLRMRWNKLQQFTVQNMFEGQCRSAEEAVKWWRRGQKNKIMGSHKMNNASSRSHSLLTLRLQSYSLQDPSQQIESKLQIIDLAGSQRQKVTKSTGAVFKQGIQINKSLFTLRQVIASLYQMTTTGKTGILPPYRDSKLTSLLKQSIGGNSYCLMIACLNPTATHYEESLQTLTYASMASYISNIPVVNIDPKTKQNQQLRVVNGQLRMEIKRLQDLVKYLTGVLEGGQCSLCKKKIRSQTDIARKDQVYGQISSSGLMVLPRINQRSFTSSKPSQIVSLQFQQQYSNLPKNSRESKVIKSTKDIIESIAMIRDLISTNSILRDKSQNLKNHLAQQQKQMFALMKQNQVLRDRWEMVGGFAKQDQMFNKAIVKTEMPQKHIEQSLQQSARIKLHSFNSQPQRLQTEAQACKVSYNDFLKGKKVLRDRPKKRHRIHSQAKGLTQDSMMV